MSADHLLAQAFGTFPDLIRLHAQTRPKHTALVLDDVSMDYAALDAGMDRVAASFQRDGHGPSDVAVLCAGNSLPYVVTFLAGLRAGVALAPLAPSSSPSHLAAMLANAGGRIVFYDLASAHVWPTDVRRIALDDSEVGQAWTTWQHTDQPPRAVAAQPDWPFNLIYSSGTTGTPKGIVHPCGMRWAHMQQMRANGYGPDTVLMSATPLYSNTTLVSVLPTLALGGTVVLMRKFDARAYLQLAEAHRATHTMLVPVQYQRLMDCPDFDRHDLSSFRAKFCTSAPFRADLKAEVLRRWPGGLTESYGLTEGGGRCELLAHLYPHKLHTVGQPATGHDIRVINEQGDELPQGSTGEVVGRSAVMMSGYHREPDKSRSAEWFAPGGERFIRTGDVGHFDEDGFLVLSDRKKDVIISGGFNVYPSDIEAELQQHPAVKEVAVVGVPSRRWGESPVAFVVARDNAPPANDEVLAWLNARVGKLQRVASLNWVDSLPRSDIGKVLKRELRDHFVTEQPALG